MFGKKVWIWLKPFMLYLSFFLIHTFFPDDEKFGLTNQIRRASVSVPSNISEGAARKSDKEFIQFLYIALGSLSELETQYLIAVRLKYIIENIEIENKINEVKRMIVGLRNYLLNK